MSTAVPDSATGESDNGFSAVKAVSNAFKRTRIDVLLKIMKVVNIINGLLLGLACVFAFTILGGSVTRFFLSVYIGVFSMMLLGFELRVKRGEAFMKRWFGFMFTYSGRTGFLLFVGLVNFGLLDSSNKGTTGRDVVIVVGLFTILNSVFNFYVICSHPAFKAKYKKDGSVGITTESDVIEYLRANPDFIQKATTTGLIMSPMAGAGTPKTGAPKTEANPFLDNSALRSGTHTPYAASSSPSRQPLQPQPQAHPFGTSPYSYDAHHSSDGGDVVRAGSPSQPPLPRVPPPLSQVVTPPVAQVIPHAASQPAAHHRAVPPPPASAPPPTLPGRGKRALPPPPTRTGASTPAPSNSEPNPFL